MEALRAAVQNGANAVYLGCGAFNARQGAKNFTPQTLAEAVKYCHVRGVAVHLTLNTLVSDKETNEVAALIRQAAESGVDAFIVQDLGVIRLCKQIAPDVPIHGSTQMSIHSLPGVQLCAAWGLSRVVLSRELSREEIRYICKISPLRSRFLATVPCAWATAVSAICPQPSAAVPATGVAAPSLAASATAIAAGRTSTP
jgi:putative protease